MQSVTYTVILHPNTVDQAGFVAEIPALPGCFAHGDTIEEAMHAVTQAAVSYLNLLILCGEPTPSDVIPSTLPEGRSTRQITAVFYPALRRWAPAPSDWDIAA